MSPSRWKSWPYAIGLALLYTSAYYLPYADLAHHYWLPYAGRQILYPSLVGTLLLIPIGWYIQSNYLKFGARHLIALLGVLILEIDVVVSALTTVGYSAAGLVIKAWTDGVQDFAGSHWLTVTIVGLICLTTVAIAAMIKRRLSLIRLLSILGYAYAIIALVRIAPPIINRLLSPPTLARTSFASPVSNSDATRPREVVWIIFDELDYGETLGSNEFLKKTLLPHLFEVSRMGVSASNAYSPARDTSVSLPSLLMGQAPVGYKIDQSGLSLHLHTGQFEPFIQANTVFAKLPGGAASGALLGYYHPYCAYLPDVNPCVALPMENVGRWFDALLPASERIAATLRHVPGSSAIPGEFFHLLHPMYRITEETMNDYPSFLKLDGHSLIFLHVNLPHYPAEYAQRVLNLRNVVSFRDGYIGNLALVDQIVDTAMQALQNLSKTRDILLIISSDHWHRVDSPNMAQSIPWIAWHVGETTGSILTQTISTVHTADFVLDFLQGNIRSQQDVPAWWLHKSFVSPLMPDQYDD